MTDRKKLEGDIVQLDGKVFRKHDFQDCRLVYSGGIIPTFNECTFDGCRFEFQDAAGRTLDFLRAFTHESNEGGRDLVRALVGLGDA